MSYPFTAESLLSPLKTDLGITTDYYNNRLLFRLNTAMDRITAAGVTLENTNGDQDLVLMYAAWLWRSRVSGEGMGRMLQLTLNNRIFGQAANTGGDG